MLKVIFDYKGQEIIIPTKIDEIFEEVIKKYKSKI